MALNLGKTLFSSPPQLVNYDYTDIADGTGVQVFYAGKTVDKNVLASEKFYSEVVAAIDAGGNPAAYTKQLDIDFDVTFDLQKTIKGTAVVIVPFGMYPTNNLVYDSYVIAKVRHWDGTAETDLVENQGKTMTFTGVAGTSQVVIDAIDLLVPQTHFKRGETLRLTIEVWRRSAGSGAGYSFLGHDPMNRATCFWNTVVGGSAVEITFGTEPSILTFQVPFRTTDT